MKASGLSPEEASFRDFADLAPVPLWRAGSDGGCTYVNQAWRDLTGRPLQDCLADGWSSGVHPEDLEPLRAAASGAHARQEPLDLQYRLRRHDGAWRWLQDRRRPIFAAGSYAGMLGCCLDVTDLREKDAECRQAIQERDALLEELLHRVRNSAQTIASLISLQAARATDRRVLGALRSVAFRLQIATLVQDRLTLTDQRGGVEFGGIVEAVAEAAVRAAANPLLLLRVEQEGALRLPAARAQPLALAFGELVANAAQHAYRPPAGGPVTVTLRQAGPQWALAVTDTGTMRTIHRPPRTATGRLGLHLAERLARQADATLALERDKGTMAVLRFEV